MEQLTLGGLIDKLKQCDPDALVFYNFCAYRPHGINCYRGDYSHLAIGYFRGSDCKVSEVLSLLAYALCTPLTGYKGGEYKMTTRTPVWVDNGGECSDTAIVDVLNLGGRVILVTEFKED